MQSSPSPTHPPLESVDQLVGHFEAACTPREQWRLGTEHEVIGVSVAAGEVGQAVPYGGPRGIRAVLEALTEHGWNRVMEGDNVIALERDGAQVTLEPGGQFELSGRPAHRVDDIRDEMEEFIRQLTSPTCAYDIRWLSVGFRPFGLLDDVPWMPKERYAVMRAYLPTRGALAHEMMRRTATVQVSIDYADAGDAADKLRCSYGVSSLMTALFANSPIVDGVPVDFESYRAHIWEQVDPDRCGLLKLAFEDGDVFRSYTEWALDVPMFFIHRGSYLPASEVTFRQFMAQGFQGHTATSDDWELHLSTLFPDVRMKSYLEMRACDSGSMKMLFALPALCRGLFYDETARGDAIALTKGLGFEQRVELARIAAAKGLRGNVPGSTAKVIDLARDLVEIAADGLSRQAADEVHYLDPLREIVATGRTEADALRDLWRETDGDPAQIIERIAHARCE